MYIVVSTQCSLLQLVFFGPSFKGQVKHILILCHKFHLTVHIKPHPYPLWGYPWNSAITTKNKKNLVLNFKVVRVVNTNKHSKKIFRYKVNSRMFFFTNLLWCKSGDETKCFRSLNSLVLLFSSTRRKRSDYRKREGYPTQRRSRKIRPSKTVLILSFTWKRRDNAKMYVVVSFSTNSFRQVCSPLTL